ncbi:MAG: helix-turn-helix domain-containing protein [Treponema sp.]|jgi:transcriptional regulator with XRE-family HTH domain|nr:helix-turn-helix domain-containing protein [Treponema sp.]
MDGTEVRAALAKNIKTLRSRRDWSQADLAEKSGLSIVYLSDIERGNKWPYLDTFVKIAEAFNVEIYELLMPENKQPAAKTNVLKKYNEEVKAIIEKSFETAKKHTLQSLSTMQDQYKAK